VQPVIEAAEAAIRSEVESVGELSKVASKFPYYKYVLSRGATCSGQTELTRI
jgi:hypothetical protein